MKPISLSEKERAMKEKTAESHLSSVKNPNLQLRRESLKRQVVTEPEDKRPEEPLGPLPTGRCPDV
jgi:hypothetical protein